MSTQAINVQLQVTDFKFLIIWKVIIDPILIVMAPSKLRAPLLPSVAHKLLIILLSKNHANHFDTSNVLHCMYVVKA